MNHWQWPSPFAQIMKSLIDLVPGDSCQKCRWSMVCLFCRNVYGAISPKGGSKPVSLVTRLEPLCDLSLSSLLEERGSLFTNPLFCRYWPVDEVIVCSSEKARQVDQGSGLISLAGTGRVCGGPIAGVYLWFSFLLFTQHSIFPSECIMKQLRFLFLCFSWWVGPTQSASLSAFRGMLESTQRLACLHLGHMKCLLTY